MERRLSTHHIQLEKQRAWVIWPHFSQVKALGIYSEGDGNHDKILKKTADVISFKT